MDKDLQKNYLIELGLCIFFLFNLQASFRWKHFAFECNSHSVLDKWLRQFNMSFEFQKIITGPYLSGYNYHTLPC